MTKRSANSPKGDLGDGNSDYHLLNEKKKAMLKLVKELDELEQIQNSKRKTKPKNK